MYYSISVCFDLLFLSQYVYVLFHLSLFWYTLHVPVCLCIISYPSVLTSFSCHRLFMCHSISVCFDLLFLSCSVCVLFHLRLYWSSFPVLVCLCTIPPQSVLTFFSCHGLFMYYSISFCFDLLFLSWSVCVLFHLRLLWSSFLVSECLCSILSPSAVVFCHSAKCLCALCYVPVCLSTPSPISSLYFSSLVFIK